MGIDGRMDWYGVRPGGRIVLLHQGAGSTIDHFLRSRLERGGAELIEIDSALPPRSEDLKRLETIDSIVVIRYLPRPWLGPLLRCRRRGVALGYLMDDDLLDPAVTATLPQPYRRRVWERITCRHRRIPELFGTIWVTSRALASKYAWLGAEQLPLHPHPSLLKRTPRLQLAYLGTSVHREEFAWLQPLLQRLQDRQRHTHVDLFGDISVNRQFRGLPRVRIHHPMAWSNYLADTGAGGIDLLLTPLLPSPFNATRAPVKFIDAARCGAAGLYSDRVPYRGFVRNREDGLLLGDSHDEWLAAIEGLIEAPEERERLARGCRQRALALAAADDDTPGPDDPSAGQDP